jgi:hypothetical protein
MSSKPTYTPQANSLPSMVVGFFQNNPDEHLTLEDIADKFQCTRNNIHTNLALATQHGLVVRDRNEDGDYIYKAGAGLPAAPSGINMDAVHSKRPAAALQNAFGTKPRGYTSTMKMLDLDALTVEYDVPYMPQGTKDKSKWQPLFDKLTKPGQSIAIPGDLRGAVGAAANKINGMKTKGTFRVAMVDAETARVWRTA